MYVSVLGDSVSTYDGFHPVGYHVYYRDEKLAENDLTSAADTWWMRVIDGLRGELCVNNSFAGSFVYETCEFSVSAKERCEALHCAEREPDAILIYAGINDCIGRVPVNDFCRDYAMMLYRIGARYPKARIFASTLLIGARGGGKMTDFLYAALSPYNRAIREAVLGSRAELIDLAEKREFYSSRDGTHPDREGHRLLADYWMEELKKRI